MLLNQLVWDYSIKELLNTSYAPKTTNTLHMFIHLILMEILRNRYIIINILLTNEGTETQEN